jgi:hypothetical protein
VWDAHGVRRRGERRDPDPDALARDALDVRIAHELWDLEDLGKRIEHAATQCGGLLAVLVAITAVTATAIASAHGLHPARLDEGHESWFWITGAAGAFFWSITMLAAILARMPPSSAIAAPATIRGTENMAVS